MTIKFLIILICYLLSFANSDQNVLSDDPNAQWRFIVSAIKSSQSIRCDNLTENVPGGFFSSGETRFTSDPIEKIKIMKENCIGAITSLLELHLPRRKRKYSFKFSDINSMEEIMLSFCEESAVSFFNVSKFVESAEGHTSNIGDDHKSIDHDKTSSTDGQLSDHKIKLVSDTKLKGSDIKESCGESKIDFSKTPVDLTSEELSYSTSDEEQLENDTTPIAKHKTPKILITILRSVLDENKEDLPVLEMAITQLPKQIQNKIRPLFRSKNIDGIVEIVQKLSKKVLEQFINSIELEKRQIKFQLGTNEEHTEYSIPLLDDEWKAILDFMDDPSSPIQSDKRIIKHEKIKIPREFKYSNGVVRKFIQYCRRGIRSLAYEKYVSEDGVTYYSYNENNKYGILIAGNDSDHRKEQVEAFCYMVFEKLYGKKERDLMQKRHLKALEIKKSWEDGGEKGAIIDELLKSFSEEVNDERLQWLFLVESASIPNPLVYSTDLPRHTVPISFTSKPTDSTTEIGGKIRSFVYNCRSALMTLGVEKFPGTKSSLNKIHLGSDKIHGLIKFCKSVAQRYMGRLVEWFNIIHASLDDDVVKLVDTKNPEFRCPDYFEYEDESKLADNCYKTILMMISENKKAEENRREKVWRGLKINSQTNHVNQHIRSFCNSVAYERPDVRIAAINEFTDDVAVDEDSQVENDKEGYSKEQQAIDVVEERLKEIESKQAEYQVNSAYKLDKWNQIQELMIENRRVREKLDKYSRRQFQQLFEIEDAQKELLISLLSDDTINERKKESIRDLLDKYSSDLLSMRTEWADLLFQMSNNNRRLTEVEIEIMNFVHQALDYIAISHRAELVNSSAMGGMINWEETLIEKEKIYINSKMTEYTSRLDSDQKIQKVKDMHYKRRQLFEKNLYRVLPRKLWNRVGSLGGKGLYPLIPIKISEKEIKERKGLIVKLQEEKNNMIAKYDSEGQRLARQLVVIEKVVDKHLADLNEMWDSTYSIEYSIQWELRIKDMQDTYLYLNTEYNRNAEFITRQQLRQSQLQMSNPQYQQLLSETNQSIEIATEEMKRLLKLMNDLRQKRNELDTLVESDLSKNYAEKINALRRNSKLLEDNISNDISILQKKNEISQLQLNRDIKYFEITSTRSALSERLKKSDGLIEANLWLNTKNDQLFSSYESKLKDDLDYLTYAFEKSEMDAYVDMDDIPKEAFSELNKYKEHLKMSLFNVKFFNDNINDNDIQHIRQFESLDANVLAYRELFESEGEVDDGSLYAELSILEWNFIQSRWELLKLKHFYIEKKEKILLESAEMRNSLDDLMLQKFGMVPVTKPKSGPSKASIIAMKGIGIDLVNEQGFSDEKKHLSYDEKVLKLVQKRLEDANSVFEQELSNRLGILDEKIRDGRIKLHEAAREVVSNWELQQSTASFRFASPQNKDRMREAFVKERDKVTKFEIKKMIPLKLEKHILLQQQKDRALQFKRDMDWIHMPGRVASQLMKFEQKIRIFRKKRHDHYEKTLAFLKYQAEQVDRIREIDEELNYDEASGSGPSGATSLPIKNIQDLKRERELLETDLAQRRREYQAHLSAFQNERDALYDVTKNLTDDEHT